jgi:protein arginine kinase
VNIEELAISEGIWSSDSRDVSDIVLKSSIKFFRNLDGHVFAHKLSKKEKERIIKVLVEKIKNNIYCTNFSIYNLDSISIVNKNILIERNILFNDQNYDGILILSNNQDYYFLLCNRDHIEFIVLNSGFLIDDIYVFGKKVILQLEHELPFSFYQSFGYLSSYPENSGSGVTYILTLHLPGLIFSSKINEIIAFFDKRGIGLNSSWIEGYYEIYNKYSFGFSEKEIYENTVSGFKEVINHERESREQEYNVNKSLIEDKVWRSYGILLSSRLISLYETFDLLSHLRFGISLGIINYLTIKDINLLLYYIQDFHLKKRYNIEDENVNIDEFRAQFLRDYLKEVI